MKTTPDLGKWLSKIWAPIGALLGAVTAIIQFIQLWRGDQETVTQVFWVSSAILIWISLYHVGFSHSKSPIIIYDKRGVEVQQKKPIYTYGESLSKVARSLFFLSLVGIMVLWGIAIRRINLLNDKVVVLIADFDGPNPKNYRVTEELLSQLSNSLSGYNDTAIIPLGKTITEQDGKKKAQDLGNDYHADLVIWGWYGVTESDVLLTVHVENLSALKDLPLMPSNLYAMQLPAEEIKSFQIQQRLSSQMTALTLFLGGVTRYEADDYPGAINRFNKALNEQWLDDVVSKKVVHLYRTIALTSFELATNPIIPNTGLAGIKIGDSVQDVEEHLGTGFGWAMLVDSSIPDCCIFAGWDSKNGIVLMIFFSITERKVVDMYADGSLSSSSGFIPLGNGASIGTSEEDLLKDWGNPISTGTAKMLGGCKVYYYNGISFQMTCDENMRVNGIEIPGFLNGKP